MLSKQSWNWRGMKRTPHFGQWIDSPGGKRPAVLKRAPQDGQKNRMVP